MLPLQYSVPSGDDDDDDAVGVLTPRLHLICQYPAPCLYFIIAPFNAELLSGGGAEGVVLLERIPSSLSCEIWPCDGVSLL